MQSDSYQSDSYSFSLNRTLFGDKTSFVWKEELNNEDCVTLLMLLKESVARALEFCHVQDPRAVENVARHLAWTQIWDINQARANEYESLPPLNKAITDKTITAVVESCVEPVLRDNNNGIIFNRIMYNDRVFDSLNSSLRASFSTTSDAAVLDLNSVLRQAVEHMQSDAFVNLVCEEMFRAGGVRYQVCDSLLRGLFEDWTTSGAAPAFMQDFVESIVDRSSHFFLRDRIKNYFA